MRASPPSAKRPGAEVPTRVLLYRMSVPLVGFEPLTDVLPPSLSRLVCRHETIVLHPVTGPVMVEDAASAADPDYQWLARRAAEGASSSSCLVADFLPERPLDPLVQLRLLSGGASPGVARRRWLRRVPLSLSTFIQEARGPFDLAREPARNQGRLLRAAAAAHS